ncbi:MAG: hypothetical protein AB2747_20680, partial [Candidatus Thiodiazotropha taylori]
MPVIGVSREWTPITANNARKLVIQDPVLPSFVVSMRIANKRVAPLSHQGRGAFKQSFANLCG